jgi:hypothetical protein
MEVESKMEVELQTKVHNDPSNLFNLVTNMMMDSKILDEIINTNLKLQDEQVEQIKKIISVITDYDLKILKNITNNLKTIFEDGVIDANDIPIIAQIITEVMNTDKATFKKFITDVIQVGHLVKIIILILMRLNLFSISNMKEEKMMRIIDASISLLNTTIILSKSSGKFCCFNF